MFQRSLLLGNRSKLILLIVLILLITLCKSYRLSKFQFDIKKSVVSSSLAILLSISTMNEPGNALIAPLADVGVKEFLVKDGRQWLRLSQPVGNDMKLGSLRKSSPEIEIQESLELPRLRLEQVGFTNNAAWQKASGDVTVAKTMIENNKDTLVGKALDNVKAKQKYDLLIEKLQGLISVIKDKDSSNFFTLQEDCAQAFAELRALQLPTKTLPYVIPEEYKSLPKLAGRAKVEIILDSNEGFSEDNGKKHKTESFIVELDGYHHPLTAGNFIDLVNQKHYDGIKIDNVQELIVQFGKESKKPAIRTIPLEIFYRSDVEPTYGITSDDDNRATEAQATPFQAYGALGMARGNENTDSAENEVFILKWRQALMPPGRNTLDGFYSCFGYIISGNEDYWGQVKNNDIIRSIKIIEGSENFIKNS